MLINKFSWICDGFIWHCKRKSIKRDNQYRDDYCNYLYIFGTKKNKKIQNETEVEFDVVYS